MIRGLATALVALLLLCAADADVLAGIIVDHDRTIAYVHDDGPGDSDELDHSGGAMVSAATPNYSSVTTSVFGATSATATFTQTRGGTLLTGTGGNVYLYFRVDADTPFIASGSFTHSDGFAALSCNILEAGPNIYLFSNDQQSNDAGTFTLGNAPGSLDAFTGSLSGTLLADHYYVWTVVTVFEAYPNETSGTASGQLTITLVPEPSALALAVLSLAAIPTRRRKSVPHIHA